MSTVEKLIRRSTNSLANASEIFQLRDETRGSYCRHTQRIEYESRPEHREPHVTAWIGMKKELRRQLGDGHVYIH